MDQIIVYTILVVVGLCLGSFAGASVWRLRALQLARDKKDHEDYDKAEYESLKKLTKTSLLNDRSKCLHCSYQLEWYDLLPLVSWVSLGGRCRKCKKTIGVMEPLIEIGVALFLVISYLYWPYHTDDLPGILRLVIWSVSGVGLAILFAYDLRWFLLPDSINFIVIGLGLINSSLLMVTSNDISGVLINLMGSVFILSGVYLIIYLVSKGKWIGFGDVKLGLGLGLLLADWQLAFVALFLSNLIGCLLVLPALITGKLKRSSHVPFGPLLITGFVLAGIFGMKLTNIFFENLL